MNHQHSLPSGGGPGPAPLPGGGVPPRRQVAVFNKNNLTL